MSAIPYLPEAVYEGSTLPLSVSFFEPDENGVNQPVLPNSVTWSLYEVTNDNTGTVVNGRSAVSITPSETVTIVLTGPDLVITSKAIFQIEVRAVYDSVLYGTDRVLVQAVRFRVNRLFSE